MRAGVMANFLIIEIALFFAGAGESGAQSGAVLSLAGARARPEIN